MKNLNGIQWRGVGWIIFMLFVASPFMVSLCPAEEPEALLRLQQGLVSVREELDKPTQEFYAKYEAELRKLEAAATKSGALDQLVAVRYELEHYAGEDSAVPEDFQALLRLRSVFDRNTQQLANQRDEKLARVLNSYGQKLVALQKGLTQQSRVQEALAVQTEVSKVQGELKDVLARNKASQPARPQTNVQRPATPGMSRKAGALVGFGTFKDGSEIEIPESRVGMVQVSGNSRRWFALRADGRVIGSSDEDDHKVPNGIRDIRSIACGSSLMLALDDDGEVSAWGSSSALKKAPAMNSLKEIRAIAAGTFTYMALKADGTVTAWGTYVGRGPNFPAPEQLSDVRDIACGDNRFFVQKTSGEIIYSHPGGAEMPPKPDGLSKIKKMVSGPGCGVLCLSESGRVIQWGGLEPAKRISRAIDVRAGGDLYAAQMKDGTWTIWGVQPIAGKLDVAVKQAGPLKDLMLASDDNNSGYFLGIK